MEATPNKRRLLVAVVLLATLGTHAALGSETLTVPATACGGVQTAGSYAGVVTISVTGWAVLTPGNPTSDALYSLSASDDRSALGTDNVQFRYSRASQGGCTCYVECAGQNQGVGQSLVGPYPPFNPDHEYTVQIDLGGASAEPITFGGADCGCGDNSGGWVVTINPDSDEDSDGVTDAAEASFCPGSAPGAATTTRGCDVDQLCPCAAPLGRSRWYNRREYVWCVRAATRELQTAGAITSTERRDLVRAAAWRTCGNSSRRRLDLRAANTCPPQLLARRVGHEVHDAQLALDAGDFDALGERLRHARCHLD
jgi:hypothetical protein